MREIGDWVQIQIQKWKSISEKYLSESLIKKLMVYFEKYLVPELVQDKINVYIYHCQDAFPGSYTISWLECLAIIM